MSVSPDDGHEELGRILLRCRTGLSTREEALASLWNLDPVFRAYRPAEEWLDDPQVSVVRLA